MFWLSLLIYLIRPCWIKLLLIIACWFNNVLLHCVNDIQLTSGHLLNSVPFRCAATQHSLSGNVLWSCNSIKGMWEVITSPSFFVRLSLPACTISEKGMFPFAICLKLNNLLNRQTCRPVFGVWDAQKMMEITLSFFLFFLSCNICAMLVLPKSLLYISQYLYTNKQTA